MRKLQLKDFIPMQMMRLTKYPLLIENLMKYTLGKNRPYKGGSKNGRGIIKGDK